MPRVKLDDPHAVPGWSCAPLPGEAAAAAGEPCVPQHPTREVILLYAADNHNSLLGRLKLADRRTSADAWIAAFDIYNSKVLPHEQRSMINVEPTANNMKSWRFRLQVWTSHSDTKNDEPVKIHNEKFTRPWFCSYQGAIAFLHWLAFEAGEAPLSDSELAQAARRIMLQSVAAENVLRTIINNKRKSAFFIQTYKAVEQVLRDCYWWPNEWDNPGPGPIPVTAPRSSQKVELPLARSQMELTAGNVKDALLRKVFGQPFAVEAAAEAVEEKMTGSAGSKYPLVMVFPGPSGHGKTHLADSLVEIIFGLQSHQADEKALVYLSLGMAQCSDKGSISTLLGTTPGYVGYEPAGGKLIQFLSAQKPLLTPAHSNRRIQWVVLLDEVDRAYPTLLEDLRSWFDQGTLRGGDGTLYEARHGLIILCTNVGSGTSVRLSTGGDRPSTEKILSSPMPHDRQKLAECRKAVKSALLNDFCHGQAPTFGRIKKVALFFQFAQKHLRRNLAKWLDQNTKLRLSDRNQDDPYMPNGFRIVWGVSVLNWVHSFFDVDTGFRGLESRLTFLMCEVNRMLKAAKFTEADVDMGDRLQSTGAFGIPSGVEEVYDDEDDDAGDDADDDEDQSVEVPMGESESAPSTGEAKMDTDDQSPSKFVILASVVRRKLVFRCHATKAPLSVVTEEDARDLSIKGSGAQVPTASTSSSTSVLPCPEALECREVHSDSDDDDDDNLAERPSSAAAASSSSATAADPKDRAAKPEGSRQCSLTPDGRGRTRPMARRGEAHPHSVDDDDDGGIEEKSPSAAAASSSSASAAKRKERTPSSPEPEDPRQSLLTADEHCRKRSKVSTFDSNGAAAAAAACSSSAEAASAKRKDPPQMSAADRRHARAPKRTKVARSDNQDWEKIRDQINALGPSMIGKPSTTLRIAIAKVLRPDLALADDEEWKNVITNSLWSKALGRSQFETLERGDGTSGRHSIVRRAIVETTQEDVEMPDAPKSTKNDAD